LECNQALADFFGYKSKEDMLSMGSVVYGYIDPNDRKRLLEQLEKNKIVKAFQSITLSMLSLRTQVMKSIFLVI